MLLGRFRADPDAHPLSTPTGRIELRSATVATFGYDDCPGHPVWLEPTEWHGSARAATYPLVLLANNPATLLTPDVGASRLSQGCAGARALVEIARWA